MFVLRFSGVKQRFDKLSVTLFFGKTLFGMTIIENKENEKKL